MQTFDSTTPPPEEEPSVQTLPESEASPQAIAGRRDTFTIAVLPDTQKYTQSHPQHFEAQTGWLAEQAEALGIRFAIHLGDVTNDNFPEEWVVADRAMAHLDKAIPYAVVPGNHDHMNTEPMRNIEGFRKTFPEERLARWPSFGGIREPGRSESNYHRFEAGGLKILVIALEWAPRDEAVAWAQQILDQHPDHVAILVTHAYLYMDGERYDWQRFGEEQRWSPYNYMEKRGITDSVNDGEDLWHKLVSPNPQIRLTLNGHVLGSGTARRCDRAEAGQLVHQMLVNFQMLEEGGLGFVRLLTFHPETRTIEARTFSPSTGESKTDLDNAFVLSWD